MEGFGAQNSERLRVPGGCSAKQGNIHFWQKNSFHLSTAVGFTIYFRKKSKNRLCGISTEPFSFLHQNMTKYWTKYQIYILPSNQNTPHVPQSHITIKKWAKQCNGPKNQRYFKEIISPMRVPIFLWERGKILYPTVVIIGW